VKLDTDNTSADIPCHSKQSVSSEKKPAALPKHSPFSAV